MAALVVAQQLDLLGNRADRQAELCPAERQQGVEALEQPTRLGARDQARADVAHRRIDLPFAAAVNRRGFHRARQCYDRVAFRRVESGGNGKIGFRHPPILTALATGAQP